MKYVGTTGEGIDYYGCAGRRSGIITVPIGEGYAVSSVSRVQGPDEVMPDSFDIVDIEPIGSEASPFGLLALGIDNTLHFTSDIRRGSPDFAVRFPSLEGTAYKVLKSGGHVLLFTSHEVCVVPHLGERLLNGERPGLALNVWRRPVEALDCWVTHGDQIVLAQGNELSMIAVGDIIAQLTNKPEASPTPGVPLDPLPWQASAEIFSVSAPRLLAAAV
jgi:hypothetical protein